MSFVMLGGLGVDTIAPGSSSQVVDFVTTQAGFLIDRLTKLPFGPEKDQLQKQMDVIKSKIDNGMKTGNFGQVTIDIDNMSQAMSKVEAAQKNAGTGSRFVQFLYQYKWWIAGGVVVIGAVVLASRSRRKR